MFTALVETAAVFLPNRGSILSRISEHNFSRGSCFRTFPVGVSLQSGALLGTALGPKTRCHFVWKKYRLKAQKRSQFEEFSFLSVINLAMHVTEQNCCKGSSCKSFVSQCGSFTIVVHPAGNDENCKKKNYHKMILSRSILSEEDKIWMRRISIFRTSQL